MTDDDGTFSRRRFVDATGATTLIGPAGCSGDGSGGGSDAGTEPRSGDPLEVLHGWTTAGVTETEHWPPTLQYGLAVVSETMTAIGDVISSVFSDPYNVEAATDEFVDAVSN